MWLCCLQDHIKIHTVKYCHMNEITLTINYMYSHWHSVTVDVLFSP